MIDASGICPSPQLNPEHHAPSVPVYEPLTLPTYPSKMFTLNPSHLPIKMFVHLIISISPPLSDPSGGAFTGGSPVNPARSLASTVVFSCYWEWVWVYLFAQVLAMAAGALYAVSFHGR